MAVEALSIAATIVIVERIVRHEARVRLRPRVECAMDALGGSSEISSTASRSTTPGHICTHFDPCHVTRLHFSISGSLTRARKTLARRTGDEDGDRLPLVLHQGNELGKALRHYRELDREVMEPELVRAIDDYLWLGLQWAETSYGLARHGSTGATLGQGYASAETTIVRQARAFGEVLARHDPRGRLELPDRTLSAMQEHSEGLRRRANEIVGWRWYPRRIEPPTDDATAPNQQRPNGHLGAPASTS